MPTNYKMTLQFIALVNIAMLSSCVSKREGYVMKTDLFNSQKRILELEQRLQKEEKLHQDQGSFAHKKIASAGIKMEELQNQLRLIRGDMNTLKRGIMTGELPGEDNPDSVAKNLRSLRNRLDSLEETQLEILSLMKSYKMNKNSKTKKELKDKNQVSQAFEKKQYIYIIRSHETVLKKYAKDKKTQAQLKFFYAESLFKVGRLRDAAIAYDELISHSSENFKDKVPFAYLRMGDSLRLLGDKKSASIYYHDLLENFPNSVEASLAKDDSARAKVLKSS